VELAFSAAFSNYGHKTSSSEDAGQAPSAFIRFQWVDKSGFSSRLAPSRRFRSRPGRLTRQRSSALRWVRMFVRGTGKGASLSTDFGEAQPPLRSGEPGVLE